MQRFRNALFGVNGVNTKRALLAACAALALLSGNAYAQSGPVLQDGTTIAGHLAAGLPPNGGIPTGTNCTVGAQSTDFVGTCSATATSAVAIAFGKAFAKAPSCVVLDHTTASGSALATEPTTTGFTLGTTVSGDKVSWICIGQVGN